ncbi:MAG: type II toxin-antitoxin system RelE/ParE family toxin [Coriobacteriia bacterium]|nr:type II toxin-antitoxin system RelE/ParE family toxin [Coriobacteriia bacterium]
MTAYRIDISSIAERDMRDIVRHISIQLYAPMAALNLLEYFDKGINALADMPQRCPLVTDDRLSVMGYRKLVIKNYIVFFTIDEENKVVDIERVLYARRDWLNIL